jgi:hypothetical protein
MAKKKMLTAIDSNYRLGMNSLDDPKALRDGECVSLVNALPGYPLKPRRGSEFRSVVEDATLVSKPFYMTAKMWSGSVHQWVFFWTRNNSGGYRLRYVNVDQPYMRGVVDGIDYGALNYVSPYYALPQRFDFQMVGDILYTIVNYAGVSSSSNSFMYAVEVCGSMDFSGRRIPGPDVNATGFDISVTSVISSTGKFKGDLLLGYSYTLVKRDHQGDARTDYVPGDMETAESVSSRVAVSSSAGASSTVRLDIDITVKDSTDIARYGFTHIRIYRTRNLAGAYGGSLASDDAKLFAAGADKYFLMDIPIPSAFSVGDTFGWDDLVSIEAHLGEMNQLTSFGYTMPPDVGRNLLYFKDRLFMGTDSGQVFFSEIPGGDGGGDVGFAQEAKVKYALWFKPLDYRLDLDIEDGVPITGLASLGDDLYLFKQNKVYAIVGGDPVVAPLRVVSDNVGCPFPNAITKCIIAGQEALFFLSGLGPMLITTGGSVKPFEEFKVKELWPNTGLEGLAREKCSASFWNNTLWISLEDENLNIKIFGYLSSGEDNGAFEVEHFYQALVGQLMATTSGRAMSVCNLYDCITLVDFFGRAASVDSYVDFPGITGDYPLRVGLCSRKLYPGPVERSVSELFRLTAYCRLTDSGGILVINIDSNRYRTSIQFDPGSSVFLSAYPESAETVRQSIDFVPKAGFIGEYFQYDMERQIYDDEPFEFYSVGIECIPRPQLDVESLVGGGSNQKAWE